MIDFYETIPLHGDYLDEKKDIFKIDNQNPVGFGAENCWINKSSCQSSQLTWPMESDDDEFCI